MASNSNSNSDSRLRADGTGTSMTMLSSGTTTTGNERDDGVEVTVAASVSVTDDVSSEDFKAPSASFTAVNSNGKGNVDAKAPKLPGDSHSDPKSDPSDAHALPPAKPIIIGEEQAWLISKLLYTWANPMFRRASELRKIGSALEMEDLLPLPAIDQSDGIGVSFEKAWDKAVIQEGVRNQKQHQQQQDEANKAAKKKADETADAATATMSKAAGPKPTSGLPDASGTKNFSTKVLQQALFRGVLGWPFIVAGMIKFVNTVLQFSFPLLLNAILKFIEQSQAGQFSDADPWYERNKGYLLAVGLFFAVAAKAVTENQYFYRVFRAGYHGRVAISAAVYNKALRLANAERQSTTLGELVNLMQVDATKIEAVIPQLHVLWDGILQITGYMVILYTLIGWSCFAGLLIMVLAGPMQGRIMGKLFEFSRKMVKYTDERVKVTNEALQGIQCVKMYTWEDSFQQKISKSRSDELTLMRVAAYMRAFSRAYMGTIPGIVAVASFVVYALAESGAEISASTLFAALIAFEQLRFPLLFYPMALALLAQARVSAARVETFLKMNEVGRGEVIGDGRYVRDDQGGQGEIVLKDATIYWSNPNTPVEVHPDDDSKELSASSHSTKKLEGDSASEGDSEAGGIVYPKPILNQVTLRVAPGELCAVVGRVASGKSTLCSAILNEAVLASGEVLLKGRVAYVAQSAWILNASLRDNILFGRPMDRARYDRVIEACQLTHDLALLDDGDLTEIGERGINLSGGQKQRVSIARAAYSDADVIILDDPLSALDPEVGKKLFEECIVGLMKGKTILFVTNQLQFLRQCDSIVALGRRKVLEQGTYDDLTSNESSEITRILRDTNTKKSVAKSAESDVPADIAKSDIKDPKAALNGDAKAKKDLMTKEERNTGAVAFAVYMKYIRAGGGMCSFSVVLCGALLSVGISSATSAWVSFWTSDTSYERNSEAFYLGMYGALAVAMGIIQYWRTFLLVRFGIAASAELHKNLLTSIFNAPQSFFDTTPVGRILSRFSKDFYSIDMEVSEYLDFFVSGILQIIVSIVTIVFVTPWFGIAVIPLGIFYFQTLQYFRQVSRETKRIDSVSRSPVYAQFSESLGGLVTIRAYGENTRFIQEFEEKIDQNTRAFFSNKVADRWLSVRLELTGAAISGLTAVFAVNVAIQNSVSGQASQDHFASLAGLSLTFAISLTSVLNWAVRSFAQLENAMNASERVLHYTENIPQEAPSTSRELEKQALLGKLPETDPCAKAIASAGGKAAEYSSQWPEKGEIVLKDLRMRYRSETPLVLKGLNVTITGGQRIGVVGRTGSGKSSLLLCLLRLVEPDLTDNDGKYEPPLTIDGIDVLRIGLKELRSKLGIIPQNPVLFSGTIRSNIDPFGEYSDDQIWSALEKCGMRSSVESMPGMLQATVAEYGENLSAGMRQMLVLGRALLKECHILLLDEATSSVDYETDQEIQRTIREGFAGCTVLTIAHRINTIMDSDQILVMKDGLVEEFAPPQVLLQNESSTFSEIVRQAKAEGK